MKYLSYINRIHNFWKRFGIAYAVWLIYLCHFFSCDKQLEITKLTTRENLGPTKYWRKKFWTHEILAKAQWHDDTRPTRPTKFSTLFNNVNVWYSHRRCFTKKIFLKFFAKFLGKYLCQNLFFNKVVGLQPATWFNRDSSTGLYIILNYYRPVDSM